MATAAEEPATVVDETVQVDADETYDEQDSAYGSDQASYTTSLTDSVTNYHFENGRRYHAYKQGTYVFPNDEQEVERLDIVHAMFTAAMHQKLFYAPLRSPKRALDLGTGSGIWAMEFADLFPGCEVIGNDLSPIQPRWVPPNVRFEIDDFEDEWLFGQPFDYIHSRFMTTCVRDFPKLIRRCFAHCAPGGYVEFQDFDSDWTSPDGSLTPEHAMRRVGDMFTRLSRANGFEPAPGPKLEGWFKDAGFVDVRVVKQPIPCGVWPADKRLKEVGAWQYLQLSENFDGIIMAVFNRMGGITKEEVHVLSAQFREDMKNPKIHPMLEWYVVTGRKPDEASTGNA